MKIINLSSSERCRVAERVLASCELKNTKTKGLILLPVPTSRDGEHISGTDRYISDIPPIVCSGDLVVGYGFSSELCSLIRERGGDTLDLLLDEGFIYRNNELTAHATLGYILSERGRDITDTRIGVIGYGRLGASLLRLLLFLGSSVTVFSGSTDKRVALAGEGVSCLDYSEIENTPFDVLINTAPDKFLTRAPDAGLFLDLASGNLYSALGAVFLPSLPEKRYPISAGKTYAKAVIDYCNLH